MHRRLTDALATWDDIKDRGFTGILIGNGASLAVWGDFHYQSLYSKAVSDKIAHPLEQECQELFERWDTTNFETVQNNLKKVEDFLHTSPFSGTWVTELRRAQRLYIMTQQALFEAVHASHLSYTRFDDEKKLAIRDALMPYHHVYSTNYDLLVYWSIMAKEDHHFDDGFRGEFRPFDPEDFRHSRYRTKVLFLHGGLHLYTSIFEDVIKRKAQEGRSLLDLAGTEYCGGATPLFVTEGSATNKLETINNSPYLRFAYDQFQHGSGNMVIFGHSLSESDQHLVEAIKKRQPEIIAISMMPSDNLRDLTARRTHLNNLLQPSNVLCFDATTHPLGSPGLRVKRNVTNFSTSKIQGYYEFVPYSGYSGSYPPPWAGLEDDKVLGRIVPGKGFVRLGED